VRYFANPSTQRVRDAMTAGLLDYIDTPAQGNVRLPGVTWCADNGCFGKGYPGDAAWLGWLAANAKDADSCRFATAPDVVGDAAATLERSAPWMPAMRALGYPVAFVAQNGLEHLDVPWDAFDVLFVGGCAECAEHGPTLDPIKTGRGAHQRFFCPACEVEIFDWKLGAAARALVADAKARGKWVHMGRVNSGKRLRYAEAIGCDSCDGTTLAGFADATLPDVLAWLREANGQGTLAGLAS